MKRVLNVLAVLLLLLVGYFCLWPVPIEPVPFTSGALPPYVGDHAVNTRLAGLQHISIGDDEGPEHLAFGRDGKLYAAVLSGNILRMNADGSAREVFANTGGRVLGFDFDASGNLIAADSIKGLLSIGADRKVSLLTDRVGGANVAGATEAPAAESTRLIRYADAVVVARSGKIYFTDASTRFSPALWGGTFESSVLDLLEQSATGRVLEYDPSTRQTRIVVRGLSFANGIALSQDETALFVNETGRYRVWKISVTASDLNVAAAKSAEASVFLDNLPGYPDNLMRGLDGRIWLGLAKPRSPLVNRLSDKPFLRKVVLRLPRALWPVPKAYGHVFAFTEEGKVVADLQDPTGAYPETTAITETADRLYVQSLHAKTIGWLPRAALKLP